MIRYVPVIRSVVAWLRYKRRVRFFMKHWQFSRRYAEAWARKYTW